MFFWILVAFFYLQFLRAVAKGLMALRAVDEPVRIPSPVAKVFLGVFEHASAVFALNHMWFRGRAVIDDFNGNVSLLFLYVRRYF